jgi:hypothetical protein
MDIAVPPITIPQFYTPISTETPENVDKSTAQVGTLLEDARADHKHDIATASAVGLNVNSTNTEGTSTSLARADHTHNIPTDVPVAIGTSNSAGTSTSLARADHVHDHGNQAGGTLHAVATGSTPGFMAAADKTKLDLLSIGGSDTQVQYNSAGAWGGSSGLTWNNPTSTLSETNLTVTSAGVGNGDSVFYYIPKIIVNKRTLNTTASGLISGVTGATDGVYIFRCVVDVSSYTSGTANITSNWTPIGRGTSINAVPHIGTFYNANTSTATANTTAINGVGTFSLYPIQLTAKAGIAANIYIVGTFTMTYSVWLTISQITI